ncbi:MAG: PTS sugar transporter subunit IIA [Victivallaceae bacterium]|nr:PTS sugar transporter subunit IIA [Victivallaceae bacterium]
MKVSFTKYIDANSIVVLKGKNKLEVLNEIISKAAELSQLDRDLIFRLTWKREQMMTTGVGNGLGLPHIRVNNIPEPVIIVGVCTEPIADYQSQDDQPVRVIVYIMAADERPEEYLQLLGSVSRTLRNPDVIKEIVDSIGSVEQILKVIKRQQDGE